MARLFRHCFPIASSRYSCMQVAKVYSEQVQHTQAVAILDAILTGGLLLSPESQTIDIRQFEKTENDEFLKVIRKETFEQLRACFTLGTQQDLSKPYCTEGDRATHLDIFGDYWIGINYAKARTLGLVPVSYFYDQDSPLTEDQVPASEMGQVLLNTLVECRDLLICLSLFDDPSNQNAEKLRVLNDWAPHWDKELCDSIASALAIIRKASDEHSAILKQLAPIRHTRFNALVSQIELVLGMFQTADSSSLMSELLYFEQSEWRAVDIGKSTLELMSIGEPQKYEKWENFRVSFLAKLAAQNMQPNRNGKLLIGHHLPNGQFEYFRDCIAEIGCPERYEMSVRHMIKELRCPNIRIVAH